MEDQTYLFKKPNHLANLNNMRLSGRMCDVTIKVNDKGFPAHKNVLAASLKYFDTMFSDSFQESKQNVITMRDVKEEEMEAFIAFAYTGEILLTTANALDLFELANYLTEDIIKEACISFLVKNLKEEDACRAYNLSDALGCVLVKNASRSIILKQFEFCSRTAEYFDLEYDILTDLLLSVDLASSEAQKLAFEGVIRWIMHDLRRRRSYMNDLLKIVQITNLKADFLLEYICYYAHNQDYEDVVKNIITFYGQKKQETKQMKHLKQTLMIMGCHSDKLQMQCYDFSKRKWHRPQKIEDFEERYSIGDWAILNDKIYYTTFNKYDEADYEIHLEVFNPADKQNTSLRCDKLLSKFLYLCGGEYNETGRMSSDVLRYDPLINSFATLPSMKVARCSAAAIFYQGYLHVLGGGTSNTPKNDLNLVERYDPNTNRWMSFPSMWENRSSHAVTVLDGKLYACGGWDKNSVEVFDPLIKRWQRVASMIKPRRNFVVIPYKGKLLAIGGVYGHEKVTAELYDPRNDRWEIDPELSSGLDISYGGGGLII